MTPASPNEPALAAPAQPAATSTPAAPSAAVLPPPPGPDFLNRCATHFEPVDYSVRGYHLQATVSPENVTLAAVELEREGLALDTITGVDWLAEGKIEVVYDYFHPETGLRVVVRSRVARENPEIPSIASVFPGANWHEREAHDFFGIRFVGHPNLTPFLLPEDATYHPLRKDFTS